MEKGIRQFLMKHAQTNPVSFHMPGHKGAAIYKENGYGEFLNKIMDLDITEIVGADNLFQAEDIIADTMKKYAKLYGAKRSYLLVNGSSGGLISAVLASVKPGGKIVMARNCHKSLFNVLTLGSIKPVYIYPDTIEEYGISGEIFAAEVAKCLDENSDADAVVIPSPNYYGICSDIKAIAEEVHKRDKVLIVDQAHGAHLKFFNKINETSELTGRNRNFPAAAEDCGADVVINSIHKTLASFTQSAVLNLCSDRVDRFILEDKLQTIESSSPSYPMMASLDINADLLFDKGEELMTRWSSNLEYFYNEAENIPGIRIMQTENLDKTKLNIDMSAYGIDGNELENLLIEKGIFVELVTGNILMCMTGIGNCKEDYDKLLTALREIVEARKQRKIDRPKQPEILTETLERRQVPCEKILISLSDAEGRVCASSIIPYPPGIPIVCPGEVINCRVIDYIKARLAAKEKVIGITENGMILVGKEKK